MPVDLLQFSDRRIPRYTSYPTAVQFVAAVDGSTYAEWLAAVPADVTVSTIYTCRFAPSSAFTAVAIPLWCEIYPAAAYADLLEREIALVARHLGDRRPVGHVHWGGGTPTMLVPGDFVRVTEALRRPFHRNGLRNRRRDRSAYTHARDGLRIGGQWGHACQSRRAGL